ncbi:hypothetical protein MOTT12_03088 [Mycobacterium intracellulare subsp. yongonense]|nr:hypothetical protein MOTT12_03088 [Mycobacterium intracellulare subsp. yongonense]ARR83823.1 hypothetical protein MOTT27_03002 [Mycobacterium intracellulare subsp. yongonense]ETZ28284.1 hypothetical protein L842_3307 [Mycobacterium intracellulare MIN_052511_1280]
MWPKRHRLHLHRSRTVAGPHADHVVLSDDSRIDTRTIA